MKITLMQFEPVFLDIMGNIEKGLDFIEKATSDGTSDIETRVMVFPELFLSGYTFAATREVEEASFPFGDNRYIRPFLEISRERGIGICGGYAEKVKGKGNELYYNSSFFIGDGKLISNYRKTHLFCNEKSFFTPGDTGFEVFDYRGVKMGVMICFDWLFPESARTLAIKGAQVILHPANLVLPYCQRAMFARSLENRVFIATANRIGHEKNGDFVNRFTGASQLVSPMGEYLLEMDTEKEYFATVTFDPEDALDKDITEKNNVFKDRRKEFYL